MADNQIGDAGAQSLAKALKQNKSITTLHLGNNAIGDEGTKHLADALSCNDSLTDLYLKGIHPSHFHACPNQTLLAECF